MANEYWELKGSTQYADVDITHPVKARYIPALIEADRGNRLIEALPRPWNKEESMRGYVRGIPGYRAGAADGMSALETAQQIRQLRRLRLPLSYQAQLEDEFYSAMVMSYEMRRPITAGIDDTSTFFMRNREEKAGSVLYGNPADDTFGAFSMTAFSGAGKSSSISILTSHYAQVYLHEDPYGVTPQIAYLVVSCTTNSNLTSQFIGIGAAIDLALENTNHIYEDMVAKGRRHGAMLETVRRLVEKLSIGIIIFDEIQLMDFRRNGSGSYDSLLTLANRTKVAIATVGTEEATDELFRSMRNARRTGIEIDAGLYCADRAFFHTLAGMLFHYQWFGVHAELTQETEDTLYKLTHGIIDQLVTLYMRANLDYVCADKKPEKIDGKYFLHIANKYYRNLQRLLDKMDYDGLFEENRRVKNEMDDYFRASEQTAQAGLIEEKMPELMDERIVLENVTAAIQAVSDVSAAVIEDEFRRVMLDGKADGKTEREITRMVNERIQSRPKPKRSKAKSAPVDLMNIQTERREA